VTTLRTYGPGLVAVTLRGGLAIPRLRTYGPGKGFWVESLGL
jgi:hypothetical protein